MSIFKRGDASEGTKPKKDGKKRLSKISKWFRELKSELKKVVWPSRSQVTNNTWVVLVCIVIVGVALWIFDYVAGELVQFLINVVA